MSSVFCLSDSLAHGFSFKLVLRFVKYYFLCNVESTLLLFLIWSNSISFPNHTLYIVAITASFAICLLYNSLFYSHLSGYFFHCVSYPCTIFCVRFSKCVYLCRFVYLFISIEIHLNTDLFAWISFETFNAISVGFVSVLYLPLTLWFLLLFLTFIYNCLEYPV